MYWDVNRIISMKQWDPDTKKQNKYLDVNFQNDQEAWLGLV